MAIYRINELVSVEETPGSSKVIIECDDRTGTGLLLEQMAMHHIGTVPRNWLEILIEADRTQNVPHDSFE